MLRKKKSMKMETPTELLGEQLINNRRKEVTTQSPSFLAKGKNKVVWGKEEVYSKLENLPSEVNGILEHELELAIAKDDYLHYMKYVNPNFVETHYHRYLAKLCQYVVDKIESGKTVKIAISVPPQTGKSYSITEKLPSYFVGRNPNRYAMIVSHDDTLAQSFGDRNRETSRQYWNKMFGLTISATQDNKTEYAVDKHEGGVMSFGLTAGITGHGASLIIIDDPYGVDVNSETVRVRTENAIKSSVFTRLRGKGTGIILISTRMHYDDLMGKLGKESDWFVINIPAVCEDEKHDPLHRKLGEALCEEIGRGAEWAVNTRRLVGEYIWNTQYMGRPAPENGYIFKKEWIKYYTLAQLPNKFDEIVQSWDLATDADKKSDYVAGGVWGRVGADRYLLKRIHKRMAFTEQCEMIKKISNDYPTSHRKLVEKRANGGAVIDALNKIIGGIIPINPEGSKEQRANAVSPYFESGYSYLPCKELDSTIDEDVTELLQFPFGKHDDEVDQTTQYLNDSKKNGNFAEIDYNNKWKALRRALGK